MIATNQLSELSPMLTGPDRLAPHSVANPLEPSSQKFDFRTDGPPRPVCDVCSKRFEDWSVPDEDWRKLPEMYWRCQLCKDDYRELFHEAGHDPGTVAISDEPWQRRLVLWEPTKDMPPDHTFVLLKGRRGKNSEIRECKVIRAMDPIVHVVRVFKRGPVKRSRGKGSLYLACWSKLHYCRASGRPIMVALGRLPRRLGLEQHRADTRRKAGPGLLPWPASAQILESYLCRGKPRGPDDTTIECEGSTAGSGRPSRNLARGRGPGQAGRGSLEAPDRRPGPTHG